MVAGLVVALAATTAHAVEGRPELATFSAACTGAFGLLLAFSRGWL